MSTIAKIEAFLEVINQRIKDSDYMEYIVCALYEVVESNFKAEFKEHVKIVVNTNIEESELPESEYNKFMTEWKWVDENVSDVYDALKLKLIRLKEK